VTWTSSWQAFVVYACTFLGGSMLPIWLPLQGACLVLGGISAFMAGTMRMLNLTRPFWDREDAGALTVDPPAPVGQEDVDGDVAGTDQDDDRDRPDRGVLGDRGADDMGASMADPLDVEGYT
jgi:hypothetical protein